MKKTVSISVIIFNLVIATMAQVPQKMTYQALVRDSQGILLKNHSLVLKISIMQDSIAHNIVYTESHLTATNDNGLLSVKIGNGFTNDDFSGIDWSLGDYYVQSEVDWSGRGVYELLSVSQLLSVPYALYAANAVSQQYVDSLVQGISIDTSVYATIAYVNAVVQRGELDTSVFATRTYVDSVLIVSGIDTLGFASKAYVDSVVLTIMPDTNVYATKQYVDSLFSSMQAKYEFSGYASFVDPRDSNVYKVINIGNQVWMAENLRYLPQVDNDTSSILPKYTVYSYFWYGKNDGNVAKAKKSPSYIAYGTLYNFVAAKNVCPVGWKLPSDTDWVELEQYLGMDSVFLYDMSASRGWVEGSMLAGHSGMWKDYSDGNSGYLQNLENSGYFGVSGFDATPGGYINTTAVGLGIQGSWWTSTINGDNVYFRAISHSKSGVNRFTASKCYMSSVRCIQVK